MKSKDNPPERAGSSARSKQDLRRRAEEVAREKAARTPEDSETLSPERTRDVIHDLRVHQIELEMQNEELRRAQAELDAARERYFDLYDLAPVGYITLSEQGLILEANLTAATLLGVDRGVLVKRRFSSFIVEAHTDIYYLYRKKLLDTGEPQACELRMAKKDGTAFWARMEATLVREPGGAPVCRMVLSDISEYKLAEEKLGQTRAELERSNEELQRFAYVASHDLQEPLRVVASYVRLLERRYKDRLDSDANDFIKFAVDGTMRMQNLIDDLLVYSRVASRSKPFTQVNMGQVLETALANLDVATKEGNAEVTHGPLPMVTADEGQMKQVLQNLVGNSIKFHGEDPPRVHVSAEQKGNEWVFSVKDNGIGIEPQYFERIFVIFQRLGGQDYPGTGIGLAIVKRIVERHHGCIWVESVPGKGSTFNFSIPNTGTE